MTKAIAVDIKNDVIKTLPAADVVEVVRCGLCKNYALDREKGGFCKRSASPSMWRDDITPLRPDDFCSYGKRRETTPSAPTE